MLCVGTCGQKILYIEGGGFKLKLIQEDNLMALR